MSYFNDENVKEINKNSGAYMELEQGPNRFRIVSDFVWGYKYNFEFKDEGKEKKYPFYKSVEKSEAHKFQYCALMAVYDYSDGSVKQLSLHQQKILNPMQSFLESDEYGDLQGYDIIVNKKGEGRETRYEVMPTPPKALNKEAKEAVDAIKIVLDNAYEGKPIIETK